MGITVDELLNVPFSNRTIEDKVRIVLDGKPRPFLNKSAVTFRETDGVMETQHFDISMYDHVEWLTGCEKRQSFFCWPCLLFMPPDLWNKTGIFDFVLLLESMPKHGKTTEHVQAELHLQLFVLQHLTAPKVKVDDNQHNELVLRNKEMLKRVEDVLCYIVTKDIPSPKGTDCWSELKAEDCIKALRILRTHDSLYVNHIDDAIALMKISPNMLSDLVDVTTNIVKMVIKNEMQFSTYVSLILSEHSTVAGRRQISTFLRYVKDGKVRERFLGFSNMSNECTTLAVVFNHISNIIEEFGISNSRLLGLSVDGGVIQSDELLQLTETLKANYPFSFFVPCYFHGLHQVLQQSLSEFKECGLFFKMQNAMEIYFQRPNRWKGFEHFMFGNIPNFKNTRWRVKSQFIKVVSTCRVYFIQFLNSLVENSNRWNGDDVMKAWGFLQYLKQFKTVFLLQVLTKLFEYTETMEAKLKSHAPESAFNTAVVVSVISDLTCEAEEGFEKLWESVIKENENDSVKEPACKRIKMENESEKLEYRELFVNIVNRVITEIKNRFFSLDKLQFCRMLNNENGQFAFSNDHMKKLMETQGPFFDEMQMPNEMAVLRTNGSDFADKNVYDLLEFFTETDAKQVFKNVHRLAELILTLPIKPPTFDGNCTKIEAVRRLSYIPEHASASGDTSVLHVESDIFQDLKKNMFFYDEVAAKFYEVNKTMELSHKSVVPKMNSVLKKENELFL